MTDNEKFLARSWYYLFTILSGMIIAMGIALWTQAVPDGNRDQAFLLVGALLAKWGDSIAWRISSSKSSSDKDAIIAASPPPPKELST